MKGQLIVIEGIRGSGKSTQLKLLAKWLKGKGHNILTTDEPTHGPIGNLIRELVYHNDISPRMDTLLFAADRFWHVKNVIEPALDKGKIVLCDRYYYSTLAMQSSQGLSLDWIKELHRDILKPDLTIILDVPAEVGLKRAEEKKGKDKFTELEFLKKCRETYRLLVYRLEEEIFIVDGTRGKQEVNNRIRKTVTSVLEV